LGLARFLAKTGMSFFGGKIFMKRRTFLASAASGALGLAATLPAGAQSPSKAKRTLKMVTCWPKNLPGSGSSAERLAKRIALASRGELDIRVYSAGELVGPFEAFDAVSSGAADLYHGAEYYWQGKSPAFSFFTSVPFGMTTDELNAWVYWGGGQQLWDELSARFNIKPFFCANTGHQLGGWYRKEIKSLDDFKGLKFRMPGLGGEVLRRLGAAAIVMPGGEIFPALQSGAIDGTEWVGPWADAAFGFYRVAKFYYWPGFHEPGASLSLGVNLNLWKNLTPAQQAIIETACATENVVTHAEYNHYNGVALNTLLTKHKVQMRRFPADVLTAMRREAAIVIAETAKRDPFTKRVHDSFMTALKYAEGWSAISDEPFLAVRRGSRETKPSPAPQQNKAK
jgi:TRAP-type mannitol/chloroaromatic compound transport system substrate-binding protein